MCPNPVPDKEEKGSMVNQECCFVHQMTFNKAERNNFSEPSKACQHTKCSLRPSDGKKFWKAVNIFNCKETSIPILQYQSATASTNREKANMLNILFVDCFNYSVEPLSQINQVGFHAPPITCPPEMYCSEDEVLALIKTLDTSKASDPEEYPFACSNLKLPVLHPHTQFTAKTERLLKPKYRVTSVAASLPNNVNTSGSITFIIFWSTIGLLCNFRYADW